MKPIDGYSWGMQSKLMRIGRNYVQLKHLRICNMGTISLRVWVPLRRKEQNCSKEDA